MAIDGAHPAIAADTTGRAQAGLIPTLDPILHTPTPSAKTTPTPTPTPTLHATATPKPTQRAALPPGAVQGDPSTPVFPGGVAPKSAPTPTPVPAPAALNPNPPPSVAFLGPAVGLAPAGTLLSWPLFAVMDALALGLVLFVMRRSGARSGRHRDPTPQGEIAAT